MSGLSLFDGVETEREPYRRPSMADVRAVPWNGLRSVSTFSGCGGSSMGFRLAGWRVPVAVEFIPEAARTYRENSSAVVIEKDVRAVSGEELRAAAGLADGEELDCLEGSPPCSSFSAAGSREKGWGKTKRYSDGEQRTDDLFFEYVRLVEELRPRAFVAENVPGLIAGAAVGEYAHRITAEMGDRGYRVWAGVLNAAAFGVPQDRRRLIFIGYRRDLQIRQDLPLHPGPPSASAPVPPYSLREALADVTAQDDPTDVAESTMEGYAVGRSWHRIIEEREHGRRVLEERRHTTEEERAALEERAEDAKLYFMMTVPELDEPCPTITATGAQRGAASVTHPTECRKLTPAELKSICGFPADFRLTGSREARCERMGRAVPPPFMAGVARKVADDLLSLR